MTSLLRDNWDEVAAELTRIPLVLEHVRYAACIKPLLSLSTTSRILEAGCGAGRILRALEALGYQHLTAIEISLERLRYVRRFGPACANLICSQEVPFGDGAFDAVVSAAVIEHVIDPKSWLAELSRVTRKGGIVSIVSDPYMWRWLELLGLYRSAQPLDQAIWPWKLLSWARAAGLRTVASGGFVNVPEQRWYFVRQLKRLSSMRRWLCKWRGIRRQVVPAPATSIEPPADEVPMILGAVREFTDARGIDMHSCIWSYENFFWFVKE
jgi:SAM-dependent methyltransferase